MRIALVLLVCFIASISASPISEDVLNRLVGTKNDAKEGEIHVEVKPEELQFKVSPKKIEVRSAETTTAAATTTTKTTKSTTTTAVPSTTEAQAKKTDAKAEESPEQPVNKVIKISKNSISLKLNLLSASY